MFRPGCLAVPLAEAVMFVMLSFSNRITSNDSASIVLVFSTQSLRRFTSAVLIFAALAYSAAFRTESFGAFAARRWCFRYRASSLGLSCGQLRVRPSESAAVILTPRSTPTTAPVPGAGFGSGMIANAVCHCPLR